MRRVGVLALIVVVGVVAFLPLHTAGWLYEDAHWRPLLDGGLVPRWSHSLTEWTYQLDTRLSGSDPRGFHVTNLIVHFVNVGLVLAIAAALDLPWLVGAFAAAILCWHPLASEAVSYISGRDALLSTTGTLLAVLGAVRLCRRPGIWGSSLLLAAGLVIALWAKLAGVVVIPALFWITICLVPRSRERLAVLMGACALASLLVLARPTLPWMLAHVTESSGVYAGQQAYALLRMLALFILPIGFSIDHDFGAVSLLAGGLSLVLLAALLMAIWHLRTQQPVTAACLGWALLMLLPRLLTGALYFPNTPDYLTEAHAYALVPGLALGVAPWLVSFVHLEPRGVQ